MGLVVVLPQPNTLSSNQMSTNATLCLTIQSTALSPILTLTTQTTSRAWKMSLMPLTIMPNKLVKASSSTEKTRSCVGLPLKHRSITMALIRKTMILLRATYFVPQPDQPLACITMGKIWVNSIFQPLVATIS